MSRSTEEWVATHDDQAVPPRVRLRIFERHEGRCYLSGRKIMPGDKWDVEHKQALSLGGEHREGNMAPALVAPHKVKTKSDRRMKAKNDRVRKKYLGIRKPSKFACSKDSPFKKKFDGTVVRR